MPSTVSARTPPASHRRGSPPRAAASDEAGADHEVATRPGSGRARSAGVSSAPDPGRARSAPGAASRATPNERAARAEGDREAWTGASRNPNGGVYRAACHEDARCHRPARQPSGARPRRPRAARLHQPRPRRRRRRHRRRAPWSATPTRCSTPPTRAACATSTRRAPTAAPRRSWPRGSNAAASSRGDVTVGSKWGYTYTADWRVDADEHEVKDLSVSTLRRQLGETRALLGEHLALYQIHSATLESGVLDDAAVREELARLREEGVCVGFTATGPRQADDDRARAGGRRLRRRAGDLEPARALGHRRAGRRPRGRAGRDRQGGAGQRPAHRARRRRRAGWPPPRASAATTPDALALAAVLAQPWVDVVLSGAATVDTLRSNLAALDVAVGRAGSRSALAALAEPAEEYWERRSELAWN